MKESTIAIIGVAVIAVFGMVGWLTLQSVETTTPTRGDVELKVEQDFEERYSDRISPAERTAFMKECTVNGQEAYCACTLSYLEDRLTPAEMREMGNNLDREVPQIFWDAVNNCAYLVEL